MSFRQRRRLCVVGLGLLVVAGLIALTAASMELWPTHDERTQTALLSLAVAVGFTGQSLVATCCVPTKEED